MRIAFQLLIIVIMVIAFSCERNENVISKEDIIGEWLLEKEEKYTKQDNEIIFDTVYFFGDKILSINKTNISYTKKLNGDTISSNQLIFYPPDTIYYNNCPEEMDCFVIDDEYYKIIVIDNNRMVLKSEKKTYIPELKDIHIKYYSKWKQTMPNKRYNPLLVSCLRMSIHLHTLL